MSESALTRVLEEREAQILADWLHLQQSAKSEHGDDPEARDTSRAFLRLVAAAATHGSFEDVSGPAWSEVRLMLSELSASRSRRGFSPSETAMFVFSLKQPIFEALRAERGLAGDDLYGEIWKASVLLDRLGLHSMEVHQKTREEVIGRQQEELLELSTPVVQLWTGILALPLIGTLDSGRTQVVMESLLQRIIDTNASLAIIDITGVPLVDTLVAQHLLKTIAAARLMGADCIISGIRPQIAQTIVHLGVELNAVVTKATLADAFAVALKRTGQVVGPIQKGQA
jgi:rsbT co-antagonist protein RsbR